MSIGYTAIQWSRHKRIYDLVVAAAILAYLAVFAAVSSLLWSGDEAVSPPILAMRATGSCAIVLLHLILCIGPLARLDPRFLPILANRRHLGVMTFAVALIHAFIAVGFYHGFGALNPLVSLLGINTNYLSLTAFPFQTLGAAALLILFLLAATSHDFWLKNLSPRLWKSLHMAVYAAYALLIGHVALGSLQNDRGNAATVAVCLGAAVIASLHLATGWREAVKDRGVSPRAEDGWLDAGPASEIPVSRARVVCAPGGERIAVFRDHDSISAVTNVCAHQGGPLGEGKIINGCITCPWHGWQYHAKDGCSPPPFQEKIATYQVRIVQGRVLVDPKPQPPGTPVDPATPPPSWSLPVDEMYVGYLPVPQGLRRFLKYASAVAFGLVVGVAYVFATSQTTPGRGVWEGAAPHTLTGTLACNPYPILHTTDRGDGSPGSVLIVESGKHGSLPRVGAFAGKTISLTGTVLHRDDRWMIELGENQDAIGMASGPGTNAIPEIVPASRVTLRGEIVDSKCFLGAMKPGSGKPHKECATLCIAGGITPLLFTHFPGGTPDYYILLNPSGGPLEREAWPFIADPVEITGDLELAGDLKRLRVRVSDIRRH